MSAEGDKRLIAQTQTYTINQSVRAHEHQRLKNDVNFRAAMRRTATRALADKIAEMSGAFEVIEPSPEEMDRDPFAHVDYRWTVRIVMPGELFDYFGKQLAEARAEAKTQIIATLRDELATAKALAWNKEGMRLLMESALDRLAK